MYKILIHVSILALLEIIFFFNYVGPLESKIFKESFHKSSIPHNDFEPIQINQTFNNVTDYYQDKSNIAEHDRNNYNLQLYHKTIIYWIFLFSFTILVTFIQLFYKEDEDLLEDINYDEIEMIQINSTANNETDNTNLLINNNKSKKNKMFIILKKIGYYIFLFGCILGFEYLFFQFIILNYHIISKEELEILIIQTYLPLIDKFVISNVSKL